MRLRLNLVSNKTLRNKNQTDIFSKILNNNNKNKSKIRTELSGDNFNSLRKSVLVGSAVLALASCNDWKDHYSYDSSYNGSELLTVAEYIESLEGTQDFIDALSSTYMFNGDKLTLDTYWDLLKSDQFITVWVPNKDKVESME